MRISRLAEYRTVIFRVVTANRLRDGRVVYLAESGDWSACIADGRVAVCEEEEAAMMEAARLAVEARVVVDPYLVEVKAKNGVIRPVAYRELIRASGPSVRAHLGPETPRRGKTDV